MDMTSASSLVFYYYHIDVFLVIFVRLLAVMILLPVFSGQNVPMVIRVMLTAGLSVAAAQCGFVKLEDIIYEPTMFGYFSLLVAEFINGFTISFIIYFMFSVFYFVGQLVDYQLGFSMVSVLDPVNQLQVPVTGNLFYMFVSVLFAATGGFRYFFRVAFEAYRLVPAGHSISFVNSNVMGYMVSAMARYLELGVRIAMPVIGAIIIIDVALGLLVKAAPQMNVFVVGIPVKVFVGLFVVAAMLPALLNGYYSIMDITAGYVDNIVKGLAK